MIYFDNSSTTFPKPQCVYDALDYANKNLAFNAGRGSYKNALNSLKVIEETRKAVASFVKCDWNNVAFFSSATEALNIIINGLDIVDGDNIYISPFEHNAIIRPLYNIKKDVDFNIIQIPFDEKTRDVDIKKLNDMMVLNKPKAVLISHLSNVTGYELPYMQIFEISKKYNSINVLDSAQSFGILDVNVQNVDFIIFAGHKSLYASLGVAGFINLNNIKLKITKSGGNGSDSLNHFMPEDYYQRYESGTLNVVAIYSLLESIKWLKANNVFSHGKALTNYLIEELSKIKNVTTYLPSDKTKIYNIVSFNVDGYKPEDVAYILSNEFDICVRSGFHCSPFVHDFLKTKDAGGTVRISLGAFNNKDEIDVLLSALKSL